MISLGARVPLAGPGPTLPMFQEDRAKRGLTDLYLFMVVAAPAVLIELAGLQRAFELRGDGALWRAWTGQWTHFSTGHLAWNTLALGALVFLGKRVTFTTIAAHTTIIGVGLGLLLGARESYRGLSGITVALLTHQMILLSGRGRSRAAALRILLIYFGVVALALHHSMVTGKALFAPGDFQPSLPAHVLGLFAGSCTAVSRQRPVIWLARNQRVLGSRKAVSGSGAQSKMASRAGRLQVTKTPTRPAAGNR